MGMEYLPFPVTAPSGLSNAAITFLKGKSLLRQEVRNRTESLASILKSGTRANPRTRSSGFRAARSNILKKFNWNKGKSIMYFDRKFYIKVSLVVYFIWIIVFEAVG